MARSKRSKVPAINRPRRNRAANDDYLPAGEESFRPTPPSRGSSEPIVAKNEKQQRYINAIKNFDVTFGLGPAGTGKSWIATAIAAEMLQSGGIDKIVVTRPAVESEEEFGFLPGELSEKFEPYLAPVKEILYERLGKGMTEYLVKTGKIEAIPLAFMRGRTLKNSFVLFDEAQNATSGQMKLFLTRIGEGCKVVIDGDAAQTDIPNSGLTDAATRIQHIPCVKIIKFSTEDIVRSGFVSEVIRAYGD